jgi:hypothetical protein
MVIDSKTLTEDIKNTYPVHKHVFNVVKTLFLNEVEIVYWSVYLERFSWVTEGYSFEDNLFIVGLVAKVFIILNYYYYIYRCTLIMKMSIK